MIYTESPLNALRLFGEPSEPTLHHAGEALEKRLAEVPVSSKETLLGYTNENKRTLLNEAVLFSETSGSTGAPLMTPRGRDDFEWNIKNHCSAYMRYLDPVKDRVAILHPNILSPFVEASAHALYQLGIGYVRVYPIQNVCSFERIFEVLDRYEITTVMSTPTLVYRLLYEAQMSRTPNRYLRKCLLTGEHLGKSSISNLKHILGIDKKPVVVPFVYGSSEAAVLMIGREDGRYDAVPSDFIYELVDPIENKWISKDETRGKLLITWLNKGLMPIVRYDTGDIFDIEFQSDTPIWNPLGRIDDGDCSIQKGIEDILYRMIPNLFHYTVFEDTRVIRIDILTNTRDCDLSVVSASIHALSSGKDVDVRYVNHIDGFSGYTFTPKSKKYRVR